MIIIIDFKAGNLTSVKRALDHLGIQSQISGDPNTVRNADRIIFPGVGAAGAAMSVLKTRNLDSALLESFQKGTPILGICIGCQIILTSSEEDNTRGLNMIPGACNRFQPREFGLKVPHMGWNSINIVRNHPILRHLRPGDEVYFVHSYFPEPSNSAHIFATCEYGDIFPAAVGVDNLFAVQFHAEKSGPIGLKLLQQFSEWSP